MLVVHENVTEYKATKPMKCPNCGCNRNFDVPAGTFVRKSKRGKPPPGQNADIILLKCRKCGQSLGVSSE